MLVEKQAGDGITLAAALEWQGELDFQKGLERLCGGRNVYGPKYSVLYFKENLMQRKNQMNDRLQKMLLKKYALTKNQRYLAWLEQQSQMHISTIDSLAYDLFKQFGTDVGFGRDLSIKNLERDRK